MLPKTAVIELTSRCNHKCIFCSCPWEYDKDYKNNELSTDEWCRVIDLYVANNVQHITFTGGEPLMREDLLDILDYAYKKGISVGLISNGKRIDDEFLNKLAKYKILLSISVPGIETFKEHTGIDNVENVLEIFTKCKKLGIQTTANITVTKKNIGELYQNISYPILKGADYVLLNRFLPGGRGMYNKEFLLSNDDINKMLDIAEEVLSTAGIKGHIGTELPLCIIKTPEKYKSLSVSTRCAAAKEFFVTDPSGYIKVCNHSPIRICKWNELEKLETDETWNRYIVSDFMPKMCLGCKNKDKCDGGCREAARVNYGLINDIDPCFACLTAENK